METLWRANVAGPLKRCQEDTAKVIELERNVAGLTQHCRTSGCMPALLSATYVTDIDVEAVELLAMAHRTAYNVDSTNVDVNGALPDMKRVLERGNPSNLLLVKIAVLYSRFQKQPQAKATREDAVKFLNHAKDQLVKPDGPFVNEPDRATLLKFVEEELQ